MAADTKAAGLRAAARYVRRHKDRDCDIENCWLCETLTDIARWCEREARKLERAKDVKRG